LGILEAWAGGSVWKDESNGWVEAFHGVPFAAIPIPEDSGACKMSPMIMNGSCIILNCYNSKIAKCFATLMPVVFFLHSQIVRSTVQQLHFSSFFQIFCTRMTISTLTDCRSSNKKFHERRRVSSCEKPKTAMPVGALVRRQGGYGGGQDSKSTEPTNSSTSSIRGEIIPMHRNYIQLEAQKKHPTMGIQ